MSVNTTDHYWSLIDDRWHARAHLKWRANIYSGATPSRDNDEYWADGTNPWIGSGGVNQGLVTEPTALISDLAVRETSTKLMRKGALIIALAGQGKTKGTVAQLGIDCFGNQSLSCIDARGDDDRFLFWWLTSLYRQIRGLASDDSRDGLNQEMVGSIPIPVVDIGTQRQIADYLDRETARIDGLITEKERMLVLLEEKRAALISRVVTRGLDPNAPLKSSGLEWLGEIPAHWEEIRLGFLVALQGGATPITTKDEFWNGDIPWASPKDIKQPILFDTIDHVSELALAESSISLISPPALLLVVRGMILAKVIPTALIAVPMTINQDMKALQPKSSCLDPEYLKLAFDGLQKPLFTLIEESAHGTRCLRTDMLTSFKIPVPPVNEQREIVHANESDRRKANALRDSLQLSISLAKERRAALITAAVTGKIPLEAMRE